MTSVAVVSVRNSRRGVIGAGAYKGGVIGLGAYKGRVIGLGAYKGWSVVRREG